MAKYFLIVNDIIREFEMHIVSYFDNLLNEIRDYTNRGCKLHIGSKWIRIFDRENNPLLELKPINLKDFILYCKSKNIKFIKK